jgi:hypothetical protein
MNKHIRPHIRIAGQRRHWSVYLVVEHQSFCIAFDRTMVEAMWYQKQLAFALKRLRKKWREE